MFSSLKLSNLRGRKPGEAGLPVTTGPPHLDLTSPPSKKPPQPVITTTRRTHKWSIDRALCPGVGEKREEKCELPTIVEVNKLDHLQESLNINNRSNSENWESKSYDYTDEEQSSNVQVVTRTMNVSIERDSCGSLGITLRGGAHPDPTLSRPLIITQIKPGGPADREGTIKVGDRLLSVDGHQLSCVTLSEAQSKLRATTSPLSVLCVEYDVSVMSHMRAAQGPLLVEIEGPQCHSLGLELVNTPDNSAVVIGHVKAGSIAERCGALLPGDQILAVNDICVEDTKMTAEDVNQLLWTGNSCVLQILPSSSSCYRGFAQPLYSCPSPSQSSKHSREFLLVENMPLTKAPSPMLKRFQASTPSIPEAEVETNSGGVYKRKSLTVSLNCDIQNRFGIVLGPDSKLGVCIYNIEPRSPAERCGSLQLGDRVVAINSNPPPLLAAPQSLNSLVQGTSVTLTVEFAVAQTVMPSSGIFTVRLANNKVAGLGITISGCSHYRGSMVISNIRLGSVAHRCGTLGPGDRILSVNNHSLGDYSLDQAIDILHSNQDIVTLVVQKLSDDSSSQESFSSIHTVEFCREGGPLGITIAGSEDPMEPIIISALTEGGLAEQSQALQVGDQLLAIDSHNLSHEPLSTAIYLLQNSKDRVTLCIGRSNNISINTNVAREDLLGYSSPEIPSVDSAVESWDSLHEQSPPAIQPNLQFYKSESATVRRKQPLQSCDSPILTCNTNWSSTGLHSTNSLNTVQSDADDTCSSFKLSESVLNDYTSQLIALQKFAPPSPPCPLQVNYQHRNNTLPNHRRNSSMGLVKYHESIQANLLASPRRCRRGFHLLEDEAANFPLSEDLEINHPEITFDTFFKRVTGPSRETKEEHSKSDGNIFQVTLYKDPVYEDFGFSVSDGLYERGVFINRIRRGGPADASRVLQPFDRILQVNDTKTEDLDCCLTVPLVASAGDKLQLTVCRGNYNKPLGVKDHDMSTLPWMEDDDKESQQEVVTSTKSPTITKTL